MVGIIRFFSDNALLVYVLLSIGMVTAAVRFFQVWRERNKSIYGLEKELAHRNLKWSITILIIFFMLFLGEVVFESFLAPVLPASLLLSTPTLGGAGYPTNTLSLEMATRIALTPLPTPIPGALGCVPGQIIITSPVPGQEIIDRVVVKGTADIANFGFYKYEVAPAGSENWTTILAGREAKREDELGLWITKELIPGDYLLRLVVTDNQGQVLPPCTIPIRVRN